MNHPEHILRTLDSHLDHPVRLILYGRAALSLGFPNAPAEFASTMDVDAILPEVERSHIESDRTFWEALDLSNRDLEAKDLYLTHLFLDTQVILTPDWLDGLVAIPLKNLRHLSLFRPATTDLILTKMMRVDPQDRADLLFLLEEHSMTRNEARLLFQQARVPDIPEILEAFEQNITWLLNHLVE